MKEMLKSTYRIIIYNLRNVFIFEIIYRFLTTTLMLVLLSRSIELALSRAGYSYVTAKNLIPFFFRPFTLLVLAILLILHGLFLLIEVGALITSNQGAVLKRKIGPLGMFIGGLKKGCYAIRGRRFFLLPITFFISLFINLVAVYRLLDHVKPISFMMTEIWNSQILTLIAIIAILALGVFALLFLFVPHIALIERKNFEDSARKGWRMLKEQLLVNISLVFIIGLLILVVFALLYLLIVTAVGIGVILFYDKNLSLAIMLTACDRIEWLLIFFGSIVVLVVNFAGLTAIYSRYEIIRVRLDEFELELPIKKKISKKVLIGLWTGVLLIYTVHIIFLVQNGTLLAARAVFETQITAHRGSSYYAPENTLVAIEKAMEEFADFAEIDVQETKDGILVLLHDYNFKRTTGYNGYVWNMTYQEVLQLDAGYLFGDEYKGTKVPTLEEVLELCKGKIKLNIELKSNGRNPELAQKTLDLIEEFSFEQQCVITSTNIVYLREVKEINPSIKTGYIITAGYGNYYEDSAIDFISIRSSLVTENLVNMAHSYGKEVHAWTVNSKSELERMKLLGVDNVITDRPVLAREILFREKNTESLFEYIRIVLK